MHSEKHEFCDKYFRRHEYFPAVIVISNYCSFFFKTERESVQIIIVIVIVI